MDDNSRKIAFETQTKLLENFIRIVRSPGEKDMLKKTLQKTVDLASEITRAELGSLFLFDRDGVVTDCLLMRDTPTPDESNKLLGTVLDRGLAGWVVENRKIGVVADTAEDDRWLEFGDQPYQVRSAIVSPILKGDHLFGILSLVHSKPRQFKQDEADMLKAMTDHIAIVLENAMLYQTLKESLREIEKAKRTIETYSHALSVELEKGQHMQRTFLPAHMPNIPGWRIEAHFYPAKQLSGDFYDVFSVGEHQLCVVIADVCDKGVSAALFMGIFKSLIHAYLESALEWKDKENRILNHPNAIHSSPDIIKGALSFLNNFIERHHGREGIFATMFFGILDTKTGHLNYINAGHEPLALIDQAYHTIDLLPTGPAVGLMPDANFESKSLDLAKGDTLLGFTDGITEACTMDHTPFGRKGIYASIRRIPTKDKTLADTILEDVLGHLNGSGLTDDMTMISISRV